jgi:hypothetical protein
MDDRQRQTIDGAAREFADALVAAYRTTSDGTAAAQRLGAQQIEYFFDTVMDNLRAQAEGTSQVTRQLATQQELAREATRELTRVSTDNYMDFLDSVFSFYHGGRPGPRGAPRKPSGESSKPRRAPRGPKKAGGKPRDKPGRPRRAPRKPRGESRRPKRAQGRPRGEPKKPQGAPRRPKNGQRRQRVAPGRPKSAPGRPRAGSKRPKGAPRRPRDGPSRRNEAGARPKAEEVTRGKRNRHWRQPVPVRRAFGCGPPGGRRSGGGTLDPGGGRPREGRAKLLSDDPQGTEQTASPAVRSMAVAGMAGASSRRRGLRPPTGPSG